MPAKPKHMGESWIVTGNREKWKRWQEESKVRREVLLRVREEYYANVIYNDDTV